MGNDNVGMKTGWRRQTDPAFHEAVCARSAVERASNPRYVKDASDVRYAMIMDAGWADRYPSTHVMNAHQFWMNDVQDAVRHTDSKRFAGNTGSCRFMAPFMDAQDQAWVDGASMVDAYAAGYQAMMDFYGVEAPFWAWWV